MAGNISLPSWREDQPYGIEQTLAPLIDQPGHPLALSTLNAYRSDRDVASANYHNYVAAVNALQSRNIDAGLIEKRMELMGKLAGELKNPGVGEFISTAGLLPEGTDWQTGAGWAQRVANAGMIKDTGQGIGSAANAGMAFSQGTPVQLGYGMPPMISSGIPSAPWAAGLRGGGAGGEQTTVEGPIGPDGKIIPTVGKTQVKGGGATGGPQMPGPVVQGTDGVAAPTQPDIKLNRGSGTQAPAANKQAPAAAARTPSVTPQPAGQVGENEIGRMVSNLSRVPGGADIAKQIQAGLAKGYKPQVNGDGTVTFTGGDGQQYTLRPQQRK